MIPNLAQLLLVCGIAAVAVIAIVLLLLKLPTDDNQKRDDNNW